MKKLVLKISAVFLSLVISSQLAFANDNLTPEKAFSDVNYSHKFFTSISDLKNRQIINGYEDGSFRPNQLINRAEFLKLLIVGLQIETVSNVELPFSDTQVLKGETEPWYLIHIKTAYQKGWINGYPDNTFRPANKINKAEALKILANVQKWQTTENEVWYLPFVNYAKNRDYLPNVDNFNPASSMSRGEISEILYRNIIDIETGTNAAPETPQTPKVEEDSQEKDTTKATSSEEEKPQTNLVSIETNSNTAEGKIGINSFENLTLNQELRRTFHEDELIRLTGKVKNSTSKVTVAIANENEIEDIFYGNVDENKNFEVFVRFETSGTKKIGMIAGSSGQTNSYQINVLDEVETENSTGQTVENLETKFQVINNKATIVETSNTSLNQIRTYTFKQDNKSLTYIDTENKKYLPLNHLLFDNFKKGQMTLEIEVANYNPDTNKATSETVKESLNFEAATHQPSTVREDEIDAELPLNDSGLNIVISGKAKETLKLSASIQTPDGTVDTVELQALDGTIEYRDRPHIGSGDRFKLSYPARKDGIYIVSISAYTGRAALNYPFYIGDIVPVIPHFLEQDNNVELPQNADINELRNEMLGLINEERAKQNLQALELSDELNELSQLHADDMAENDYLSHVNLQGESPDDRRLALNISTPVSENLASTSVSLEVAHFNLMQSPSHRDNILTPEWERVGLGITVTDSKIIVVQEFSKNPFTENDIADSETEIETVINDRREEGLVARLNNDANLKNAARDIGKLWKTEGSEALTQQAIQDILSDNTIMNVVQIYRAQANDFDLIKDAYGNNENYNDLLNEDYDKIGVNIFIDDEGLISVTVLIN
jgi:hypothetical protein